MSWKQASAIEQNADIGCSPAGRKLQVCPLLNLKQWKNKPKTLDVDSRWPHELRFKALHSIGPA